MVTQNNLKPLTVYKSSAGSGKTFTLVKEYLKICLPNPDNFKRAIAITFTNAAAFEMKERIVKALKDLIKNGVKDPIAISLIESGINESELQNAEKLLENILYNYSAFKISTIDAFFTDIVKKFNKELKIPFEFEIALETNEVALSVKETYLRQCFQNEKVLKILLDYVNEKIKKNSSWDIRHDLESIINQIVNENKIISNSYSSDILLNFKKKLDDIIRIWEEDMREFGTRGNKIIEDAGLKHEDFKYGNGGPTSFFNKILDRKSKYELPNRFLAAVDKSQWYTPKKGSDIPERIQEITPQLNELSQEILKYIDQNKKAYFTSYYVLKNIYFLILFEELNQFLDKYKEQEEILFISDFPKLLIKEIINESIHFIYSRIGTRYDYYLLDEFQDTSIMQWKSLFPLLEEAIANGNECLIVGDSKQSIYRWRDADTNLLGKLSSEFQDLTQIKNLETNYRSGEHIVNFNNLFFKNILKYFETDDVTFQILNNIYQDVEQTSLEKNKGLGYINMKIYEKEKGKDTDTDPTKVPLELLLDTLKNLFSQGYTKKDIAVLFRNNDHANKTAKVLIEHNIDFVSDETLQLNKAPIIRLFLSLLNCFAQPNELIFRIEAAYLFSSYSQNTQAKEIIFNLENPEIEIESLNALLPIEFIENFEALSLLPLYELSESLIAIFNLNTPANAYIQKIQEVILEFSAKGNTTIANFLEWFSKKELKINTNTQKDAVRLMTIHKSKGLQFPVVIIPFASWDLKVKPNDSVWMQTDEEPFSEIKPLLINIQNGLKESYFADQLREEKALSLLDNINLMYVAFTRAEERLYIFSENAPIKTDINCTGHILTKFFESTTFENKETTGLIYGVEHQREKIQKETKTNEDPSVEYPVYNFRQNFEKAPLPKFQTKEQILEKLNNLEYILDGDDALLFTEKLKQTEFISLAMEMLIPGIGAYRPFLKYEDSEEICFMDFKNDEHTSEALLKYAEAYQTFTSKKISNYFLKHATHKSLVA